MTDLPEWLPGQWDLAYCSLSTGGRTMYLPNPEGPRGLGFIPIATSLTFTQGSPTFDHSGGPVPPGKGKVTVKDGVVSIEIGPMLAPPLPAAIANTIARTPEGMVVSFSLPMPEGRDFEYKAYYTRAAEEPRAKLPEWLPGRWDFAHHTRTDGGRTVDLPAGTGGRPIATSLTFTQGSPTFDHSGGPMLPPGEGKVTVKDGVVSIEIWPMIAPPSPAAIAKTPEGMVVSFSLPIPGGRPTEYKAYYTWAAEEPRAKLPEWLPGRWDLDYLSVRQGGQTVYPPASLAGIPFATSLSFTQGRPTYEYSGGPVPPGKGKVTVKDGVVSIEIGPMLAPEIGPMLAPPLPATIAQTPEGIVVNLDVPAQETKLYFTRAQEQPRAKLPEWLPGQWDLASYDITNGRRTPGVPWVMGSKLIPPSLTFMQDSSTYSVDYESDDFPGGNLPSTEGAVAVKDGVVRIKIGSMIAPPLPATIAQTPEGIIISLSLPNPGDRPTEYKMSYTRAPEPPWAELPEWLPGKWTLAHHTMTCVRAPLPFRQTSDFPAGTGPLQIAMSLTFTQGRPTYEVLGRPRPAGQGQGHCPRWWGPYRTLAHQCPVFAGHGRQNSRGDRRQFFPHAL